jgi:hypothetical protein
MVNISQWLLVVALITTTMCLGEFISKQDKHIMNGIKVTAILSVVTLLLLKLTHYY